MISPSIPFYFCEQRLELPSLVLDTSKCAQTIAHAGIWVLGGADNLVQNFRMNTRFVHDLSVDKFATANVFRAGSGVDLNMDHHKAQNWATLWTALDMGERGPDLLCDGWQPPHLFAS
jgi:hypothetical protein